MSGMNIDPAAYPLPLDPEEMNDERAEWAQDALFKFQERTGTEDGDAVSDLLSDLMHLCDRQPITLEAFEAALERARENYQAETTP
jgi:hypothetical protein